MKVETRFKLAALGSANYIVTLVNTILFPIFPQMSQSLDLSLKQLSWLVVVVAFVAAVLGPLGGLLADRWSRKYVIFYSIILYGVGGLLTGISIFLFDKPFTMMMVGRFLQGIGSATPMFLTITLAGDIFQSTERHKATGLLETANGTGKLSSPIIGSLVGVFGWYAVFFLYPLLAIPVAAAIWFTIKEPKRNPVNWSEQKKAFSLLKNRSRILALLAGFTALFVLIGTLFWLSDALETKLAGGIILKGIILSLPVATMMATTLAAELFGKKLGIRSTVSTGLFLMSFNAFLVPFIYELILFWPVIGFIGVGAGMVLPSLDTLSTSVSKLEYRGILTTVYGSGRSLGAALAPYVVAVLMETGREATFFPIAAGAALMGAVVLFLMQEKEILPRELLPDGAL